MNAKNTCPEYAARLRTASDLINKVNYENKRGSLARKKLVWLELTGCSGNIISLLDGSNPGFKYLVSMMCDLIFSNSLMASEGEAAMERMFGIPDN